MRKNVKRKNIVCKDDSEWINPETVEPYDGFNMCTVDLITSENIEYFENSVIVIDDRSNKLNKDIAEFLLVGDMIIFKSL